MMEQKKQHGEDNGINIKLIREINRTKSGNKWKQWWPKKNINGVNNGIDVGIDYGIDDGMDDGIEHVMHIVGLITKEILQWNR